MDTSFERTESKEDWITPPELVRVLGHFDLDPCACVTQPFRYADKEYTIKNDGLLKLWSGRVWMNPPYGQKTGAFLEKLARHGNGIALIFARTETRVWFSHIWNTADAVFFIKGRLNFYTPQGIRGNSAGAPSALVAYGTKNKEVLNHLNEKIRGKFIELKREDKYEQKLKTVIKKLPWADDGKGNALIDINELLKELELGGVGKWIDV